MISVHDLYDREELELVKSDLLSQCRQYGDVIGLEVPMIQTLDPNLLQEGPDPAKKTEQVDQLVKKFESEQVGKETLDSLKAQTSALSMYAHGKLFIKFSHITGAKQARYHLSGRRYNGRTVIVSFYPEVSFDQGDFN